MLYEMNVVFVATGDEEKDWLRRIVVLGLPDRRQLDFKTATGSWTLEIPVRPSGTAGLAAVSDWLEQWRPECGGPIGWRL